MPLPTRLAFVDLETTGLSRIPIALWRSASLLPTVTGPMNGRAMHCCDSRIVMAYAIRCWESLNPRSILALVARLMKEGVGCGRKTERWRHLTRAVAALHPLRIEAWPYAGPIGVRERTDLHILDDW